MALDPLKFQVAIQDDATGQLNKIEQEFRKLQDKTIRVKVDGVDDLQRLLQVLGQQQAPKIGEQVSQDMKMATAATNEHAEAIRKQEAEVVRLTERISQLAEQRAKMQHTLDFVKDTSFRSPYDSNYWKNILETLAVDKKAMGHPLYLGDAKHDMHDILEMANTLYKILGKIAMPIQRKEFVSVPADEPILALAKAYGLAREEAIKYLRSIQEASEVQNKFQFTFHDKMGLWHIDMQRRQDKEKNEFGYNNQSDWEIRKEYAQHRYNEQLRQEQKDAQYLAKSESEIAAVKKQEETATTQLAAAQQKLNELKAQGAAATQQQMQAEKQQSQTAQQQAQSVKQTGDAAQTTSEQLQKLAQSAIKGSFEQFVNDLAEVKKSIQNDNFTAFSKRIESCAEAIGKLTEAFSAFKTTISGDANLKDLLTGWGAAIKEIGIAIKSINASKGSGNEKIVTQPKEELEQQAQGLMKVAQAIGHVNQATSSSSARGAGSMPFIESLTKVGEGNYQTLISTMKQLDTLINLSNKSIGFAGRYKDENGLFSSSKMQELSERAAKVRDEFDSLRKNINDILLKANVGNQGAISFLNTSGVLRNFRLRLDEETGLGKTLLGGHFDAAKQEIREVSKEMRQAHKDMQLGNKDQFVSWNTEKLKDELYRVKTAISDIREAWSKASSSADSSMTAKVAQKVSELAGLQKSIESALKDKEGLRVPRGYQQFANADSNEQINQAKRLKQELEGIARAEATQAKEAERYTEQQKKAFERAEAEKAAAIAKTAKQQAQAAMQAQRNQEAEERNQQRLNNVLSGTIALEERMSNAFYKGQGLGIDTSLIEQKYQQLMQMQSKVLSFSDFGNAHSVQMLIGEWNALQRELKGVATAQEKVNRAEEKIAQQSAVQAAKQQAQAAKQTQKENEAWAESMRRAGVEASKLEIKLRQLKDVETKGSAVGVDTTNLKQQIALLEQYLEVFRQMQNGSRGNGFAGDLVKDVGYQSASIRAKDEAQAVARSTTEIERNNAAKAKAAAQTTQLSAEEQKLAQALTQTTESAKGQSQILSDLKSMATQYLGVWGGQQFLHNIIEIGGQLEMQRLSIGAILQNTAQAQELFDKIKGLATQSPFGVVQLDQMTKQLTAYGFKYHELYDWTKRLADISAATGTDVSRLALALGHVRSEAALSGYTLRQFSMANVPLLEKLAEKLGKSTKEIREMTKGKEIGYEDVAEVLKDLTNEGGMFYNMQETISESVKAKFKNVKDAMEIMYGEMAEGSIGEGLKGVADVLMGLTRNWKEVGAVMMSVAGVWGLHKAGIMAMNAALGSNTASITANMMAYKKKRADELIGQALTTQLTAEEKALIATRNTMTAQNIRVAMSIGALNKADVLRLVGLRKLSIEEIKALIRTGELTFAEAKAALQGRILGVNMGKAGMMIKLFGRQVREATVALLANPWTWITIAIGAIADLWTRNSNEMERAEETAKHIYESSQEALKNIKPILQSDGFKFTQEDNKGTGGNKEVNLSNLSFKDIADVKIELPQFDIEEAEGQMSQWIETIQNYALNGNKIINDCLLDTEGRARSEEEAFNRLAEAVANVGLQQAAMQDLGDIFERADKASDTGGWFTDSFTANIKDYIKTTKKYEARITEFYRKNRKEVDESIKAAREQDKAFAEATKGHNTYAESLQFLIENQDKFRKAVAATQDVSSDVNKELIKNELPSAPFASTTYGDTSEDWKQVETDFKIYAANIEAELQRRGQDVKTMSENQQQALVMGYKKSLDEVEGMTDDVQKKLLRMFADYFHIKIDLNDEELKRKEKWHITLLEKLTGRKWDIKLTSTSDIDATIEELRKKYAAAKRYYENEDFIRMRAKLGVHLGFGEILTEEQINKALQKIPKQQRAAAKMMLEVWRKASIEASNAIKEGVSAAKQLGIDIDPEGTKQKKDAAEKAKRDKEKKENKAKGEAEKAKGEAEKAKREAEEAERENNRKIVDQLREREKTLKEAFDTYKKWEKELGKDVALSKVEEQWGDLFKKWRGSKILPWSNFAATDVINWEDYIEQVKQFAQKQWDATKQNKNLNYGKEYEDIVRRLSSLQDDLALKHFQESTKTFSTEVQNELDNLTRRWEIFNKVVSDLGDINLAAQLAGFNANDYEWGIFTEGSVSPYNATSAESLRNYLDRYLSDRGYGDLFDFQGVLKMADEALEKYVQDFIVSGLTKKEDENDETFNKRLDKYKSEIPGIITALKRWRDLQKDVNKQAPIDLSGILATGNNLLLRRNKIEDEYRSSIQKTNTWLNNIEQPTDEQRSIARRAKEIALNKKELSLKEIEPETIQFYTALSTLNRKTARTIGQELLSAYKKAFDAGIINADDYSEKVKKILENMVQSDELMNGSLYDRMSKMNGWLFRRGSDDNRNNVVAAAGFVKTQIENERAKGDQADNDLIAVLERLEQALTNIGWGAGGRKEVVAAGNLGKTVQDWGKMSDEEKRKAAEHAIEDKRENKGKDKTKADQFEDDLGRVMKGVLECLGEFQQGLEFASSFFDSFGMEGASNLAADGANILGGAMQGASALSALGPYGAAAGAALGLVSGIAQTHDTRLERQIEKLREDVQKIEANTKLIEQARERTLGLDTGDVRRSYAQQYAPDETLKQEIQQLAVKNPWLKNSIAAQGYRNKAQKDMYEYYSKNSSGSGYQQEYQNLLDQRKDYMSILNKQESKKKKSNSDIEETKAKIAELDDQILYFSRDLAKELWDIDVKGWADQISDALATAFENGESMAKAYNDTVTSILQNVAKKMMQTAYLEKMFQSLQGKLDAATEHLADDPAKKMSAVQSVISEFFGKGGEGEQTIAAATEFMTAFQRGLEASGLSIMNSENSKTLSSSMQGTSEETSDLLAGYVNSLRQDVSVNRIILSQFATQMWPEYVEQFGESVRSLNSIDQNTHAIMNMMQTGSGAMFREIAALRNRFDNVVDGIERLNVN